MPRSQLLLALLALLTVWLPVVGSPTELLTAAAMVAVLLLIWQLPDRSAPSIRVRGATLRERAERLAFLRTRDPDADGRVRPRAPGQGLAAA